MKKTYFFVAALSAMALASCSKDQTVKVNQGDAIAFRAFTDNLTKATEVTTANLDEFRVYALQGESAGDLSQAINVWNDVFSGNSTSGYTSDIDHFFPGSDKLYFFALNDKNLPSSVKPNITGASNTIPDLKPEAEYNNQKDLVVAYNEATEADVQATGGAVDLTFQHVYSQIRVLAKNTNTKSLQVKVLGVRLNGFNSTSTFTLPTDTDDLLQLSSYAPADNSTDKKGDYTARAESEVTLDTDPISLITLKKPMTDGQHSDDQSFMILPQELTPWTITTGGTEVNGSYISVLCQISQNTGTEDSPNWAQVFPKTADKFAWTAVSFNGVDLDGDGTGTEYGINPGYCYTVTLDFGTGGGTTDPDQPDTGTDPEIPVDPSQPVLGSKLSFTVSVSDWMHVDDPDYEDNINM